MEQKGIALTILGIVAIIAIVGLVLLFTGGATGKVSTNTYDANYFPGSGGSGTCTQTTIDPTDLAAIMKCQEPGSGCNVVQTMIGPPICLCC